MIKNTVFAVTTILLISFTASASEGVIPSVSVKTCLMNTELFPLWRKPGDENLPFPGINIELNQHIAKASGIKIEWVRAPFQRCLRLLRQGDVDMINVASYRRDREKYGRYPKTADKIDITRRFKFDSYSAFVLKESGITWDGQSFDNLDDQLVAIEIGASIQSFLQEIGTMTLPLPSINQAFLMLEKGRVAAVVTNENNAWNLDNSDIVKLTPTVMRKPYYLMISDQFYERHTKLSEKIWLESGAMQKNFYPQILGRYQDLDNWPDNGDEAPSSDE